MLDLLSKRADFFELSLLGFEIPFDSGMASAKEMKSCEMLFQMKLMESGTFLGCGGWFWAPTTTEIKDNAARVTMRRMQFKTVTP